MGSIVSLSPFRCRVWALHDRLEGQITEETCKTEIASFLKHGQLIPALGRPLKGNADYDVELICGARRLFAARHINIPLKVELRDLSDQEAIIAMDIENRQRLALSPYERGLSYALLLREGYFKSQDELCRALKISATRISRLLKVARLPTVIVNAFQTPLDIREEWALELVAALEEPHRRALTLQRARAITNSPERTPAVQIYQQLLLPEQKRRPKLMRHDEVIKDSNGVPLFRIRLQTNAMAVLLPMRKISRETLGEIKAALTDILQSKGGDRREPSRPEVPHHRIKAIGPAPQRGKHESAAVIR